MSTRLALLSSNNNEVFAKEENNKDVFTFEKSTDVIEQQKSKDIIEGTELQNIQDTTPSEVIPIDPSQQKLSKKDLENDEEYFKEILQYREDRFGTDKNEGANYVMLPFLKQDLTKANIVDDYLDHYRFITSNETDVMSELDWLKSVKKREQLALENAKNAKVKDKQDIFLREAKKFSDMRKRAAKLYSKTGRLAELYDSKRYEGMSVYEKVTDVIDTVGGHIATQISSPLSIVSVGAGKFVAKELAKKTGIGKISQILIAAATTAPIDATQAGVVDVLAQGAEIEMGIRKDYDAKRTAQVAGVSAVVSGGLSGIGQRLALRKGSGLTKEGIETALKNIKDQQQKLASKKIKEAGDMSKEFSDSFAKDVENTFGKKAVQRDSSGKVININEDVIKQAGREKLEALDKAGYQVEIVEPAMNFNTYQRVLAGVTELFERGRNNVDELLDIDDGIARTLNMDLASYQKAGKAELENLFRPLAKGEQISSRVFEILMNDKGFIKKDMPYKILAKYGVTNKDFAAMMLSEISRAGKKLSTVSQLPRKLAQANRLKTADEIAEEEAQTAVINRFSEIYTKFENIRRATLVSGIATAQRNGLAQIPRVGVDSIIYALESVLDPSKKFSIRGSMSQLKYTFTEVNDAVLISNALLDNFDVAKAKMWNQYSEVGHRIKRQNPNQDALSRLDKTKKKDKKTKAPQALDDRTITDSVLDKWEGLIHHFNVFNRFQESLFRRGAYMASVERQLIDKGTDLVDVMRDGTFLSKVDDEMMMKAVNDALEFTYASQPKFVPFQELNKFFTNYLTLFAPFPRFMFKAMEMAYNYNVTGAITGALRIMNRAVRDGSFTADGILIPDQQFAKGMKELSTVGDTLPFQKGRMNKGAYKQLAEGLVGSAVLMPLGYVLRDPEHGMAGSEWYKLRDNKGNEFDARVYGPILTPYLLFGEILHRAERGVPTVGMRDFWQGISGANFRSFSSFDRTLEEFFKLAQSGDARVKDSFFAGIGRTLGEAWSGYGQFFLQFSDMSFDSDRRRDYKENPIYENAMDAFMQEFSLPFKRRIDAFTDDPNIPFARDPRVADIPERVLPFFKILYGATLNRTPPNYLLELGLMGFTYDSFMAKTSMADISRLANENTGFFLQEEMTYYLDTLKTDDAYKTDGKFDYGKAIGAVDSYIKSIKKQALAEAKAEINNENELLGMLIKYKSINPKARLSAEKLYKARKEKELKVSDYEIDYYDYNELFQIFKEASKIRSEGDLKRKFVPKKQKEVFK